MTLTRRFYSSQTLRASYDFVVIGAGHNGLIAASYLARFNPQASICILERRHVVGGAAVTEEIIPGFKFSRASYLLSLLRHWIITDLKLESYGLKLHHRKPFSSFTPIHQSQWNNDTPKSLLLGTDVKLNQTQIAKFSKKDAERFEDYEHQMQRIVKFINPLIEARPFHPGKKGSKFLDKENLMAATALLKAVRALGLSDIPKLHELLTASAARVLDSYFETEVLKSTLATDAVIGAMMGPRSRGSGYILLHHIMGNGLSSDWSYPEGGMGGVTEAIASAASDMGVEIFTDQEVEQITYQNEKATGVVLSDGKEIKAEKAVLSNTTPHVTFRTLTPQAEKVFGTDFMTRVDNIDYTSPVTKINVALSRLPQFLSDPVPDDPSTIAPHHRCTIHLNSETMDQLQIAFEQCSKHYKPSTKPMIEMVIPSSLDPSLAPPGAHVALLFTQWTPYSGGWSETEYAERVFNCVEEYAPGFKESVVGYDILSPKGIEKTFGLTGGNIFHGSMSLDQLYWLRPFRSETNWFPQTPVKGLYLCGSGCHPGGGVMGVPGWIAARVASQATR